MGKQHFRDVGRYSLDRKVVYFDIPCKLSPWETPGSCNDDMCDVFFF